MIREKNFIIDIKIQMVSALYTERLLGSGPPVLMLHGWGQTHASLQPLAHLLAPYSQPHLIDLPGFGKSAVPDAAWSAYDYADRIVKYLDEQNLQKVCVLGHSFGGKVAMCLAMRYPERVSRLILLATSGLAKKRTVWERMRLKLIYTSGKALKFYDKISRSNYYQTRFIPRFGSTDYQKAGAMRTILVRSVKEDLIQEVSQIACPTLILWGERDTETPPEVGLRLSKLIGGSVFHLFPYHTHEIFEGVGAHLCAHVIRPFLEKMR